MAFLLLLVWRFVSLILPLLVLVVFVDAVQQLGPVCAVRKYEGVGRVTGVKGARVWRCGGCMGRKVWEVRGCARCVWG